MNTENSKRRREVKIGAAATQALRAVGGIYCYVIHSAISFERSISL
jgi:hypothetical protein